MSGKDRCKGMCIHLVREIFFFFFYQEKVSSPSQPHIIVNRHVRYINILTWL